MQKWHDWDSTVQCDAASIHQPSSEAEVVDVVRKAIGSGSVVRTFGAGHSWSPLVPTTGVLVNLDKLASPVSVDAETCEATLQAGMRIRDAGPWLQSSGLTLRNVGAITPQSLAGAVGSGTHGTGTSFGVLGTQVSAVRLVDGLGELREFNVKDHAEEMAALRLSLGCLGVIVEVTLDCVPDYTVKLDMAAMSFKDFIADFENLYTTNERARAYWFPGSQTVYVHTMNKIDQKSEPGSVYSFFEAEIERKLTLGVLWWLGRTIPGLVPSCNRIQEVLGYKKGVKIGRCFDAITTPIPPFHQEAEVAVPIENGSKAVQEYGDFVRRNNIPVNVPSEIRFSKADDVLLSPGYGRDVCYIGGYNAMYRPNDTFSKDYCVDLQTRYDARPHWGKLGAPDRATALACFPGFPAFEGIRRTFDPNGVFANEYIRSLFAL